jgi:hypothetical protein
MLGLVLSVLAGCASVPSEAPTVTMHTTADLAAVRDMALRLADQLGPDRVLVAFDLDNTLLAMNTEIGADQWYDWQREMQAQDRCDPRLVPDRLAIQGALFHLGSMRPTQADGPELVREIQAAGLPTMLLTARGHGFRLATFRELRRNGFSFRDSAPGPIGGFAEPYQPQGASRLVRYEDGAYLLAGQHKGDMLLELLGRLGAEDPQAVIFVDDKPRNVEAVRDGLIRAGIGGEIFHYTREEPRVAAFDGELAVQNWATLEPALITVQAVMGNENFQLPESTSPEGCP